jgi:ATP-binding cassette, subfamily C, bacterial LapB
MIASGTASASDLLIWALRRYAQHHGEALNNQQLTEAVQLAASDCDAWTDVGLILQRLDMPTFVLLARPDPLRLPLLARTESFGWCLVVQDLGDQRWRIETPQGHHTVPEAHLQHQVGELSFGPTHPGNDGAESASFTRQLEHQRKRHRGSMLEVVVASVVLSLIGMAVSLYSMQIYDRVIPTAGLQTLTVLMTGTLIALLFEWIMKLTRSRLMEGVIVDIDSNLSRFIFQRLLALRVDQMPASVGSLASQLRGYEQVRAFYTSSTLFVLVDIPIGATFLILIVLIGGAWLAAIPLFIIAALLLAGLIYRRKFLSLSMEGIAFSNMKTGLLVEAVEGSETIKSGGGEWRFLQRWLRVSAAAINNDIQMRGNNESLSYAAASLSQLSYVAIVTLGAWLAVQGDLTIGALVACTILGGRVVAPLTVLPTLLVQHTQAQAAIKGIERICTLEVDHAGFRPLCPDLLQGDYLLKDVRFSYNACADSPAALVVPELRVRAGERIGIMGPIGSGKSSLLRLLTGLYRPQAGRILLDNLDIGHIDKRVVTEHVGYLQQDPRLFQGSLRDNLLIGLPDPGDQAIHDAMSRSRLIQVVANHPRGLELPIFEGGKGLSGGQRQLVAFTRLLLTRPRIWLLDEPTASMDQELEQHSLHLLSQEMRDPSRTLVVVTHKTSLLSLVNRLIIIVGNRIIIDGPRDEVLARIGRPAPTSPAVPENRSATALSRADA